VDEFNASDYWKGIILYGLNASTYKMALGKCLLDFAKDGKNEISWESLSTSFYSEYKTRLINNLMPQQATRGRLTVLERIVQEENEGLITLSQAIERVSKDGFDDVVPRFQTIGKNKEIVRDYFYTIDFGKNLHLKDSMLSLVDVEFDELENEIEARWNLLEGAFSINHSQATYQLGNNIRNIYLKQGNIRKTLTQNIPFLNGYQGNSCFYCGEQMAEDIHVDHVLPRQIINHDEIWNLVLCHEHCNLQKSDKLVGPHFIEKLIARNENIMGSNHPWKRRIESQVGSDPSQRSNCINHHYEQIKIARGKSYWGGIAGYNPQTDPFYRRLVTVLNNP
jgi:hypothetical protein